MEALPSMAAEVSAPLSQCDKVLITEHPSHPKVGRQLHNLVGDDGDRPWWGSSQEHRTCQADWGGDGNHVQVSPRWSDWLLETLKTWIWTWVKRAFEWENRTGSYFRSWVNTVCGLFVGERSWKTSCRLLPLKPQKGWKFSDIQFRIPRKKTLKPVCMCPTQFP